MNVLVYATRLSVLEEPQMTDTTNTTRLPRRIIVAAVGTALMIALGAAAIAMDSAGATGEQRLDDGRHLLSDAEISPEEAIEIALSEVDGVVEDVDLEHKGGQLVYEIEIDDTDVHVDATDGAVLYVEHDDDDDAHVQQKPDRQEREDRPSADSSSSSTSRTDDPGITLAEAVKIAEDEVNMTAEGVEFEHKSGRMYYEVDFDDIDVYIDAQDGQVLHVDYDDDYDDRKSERDSGSSSSSPAISFEEAVAIAKGEVDGRVYEVELDHEDGRLIYEIEIGNYDLEIDATDGSVLNVEWDD
jgi:uncharacterized membrane protein YkoI